MQGDAMEIGRSYAYRPKAGAGQPMLKVKLLEKVGRKGKIKIRLEDGPHPGLEEYIATRQVICAWGQRKSVIRDEEREATLAEYADRIADGVLGEAAAAVLASTGEPGAWAGADITGLPEDELQRILDRAGIATPPTDLHYLGYRDRHGTVMLPLDAIVGVARAFAAAEPATVVGYLTDREQEYELRGNVPGDRYLHDMRREMAPGHAIARQWAGLEQEAEGLRKDIGRLRSLASRAAYDLKDAGQERKARQLLRALDGR